VDLCRPVRCSRTPPPSPEQTTKCCPSDVSLGRNSALTRGPDLRASGSEFTSTGGLIQLVSQRRQQLAVHGGTLRQLRAWAPGSRGADRLRCQFKPRAPAINRVVGRLSVGQSPQCARPA
jgi:hypothetical protein